MTRKELAEKLQLSGPAIDALISTGIVKTARRVGRTVAISAEEATQLAARDYIDDAQHPPILVVKLAAATEDEADPSRKWLGWNPDAAPDDPDQIKAVSKYWRVRHPEIYVGERLAATTSGFPHAIYKINGYKNAPGGTREFDLTIDDSEIGKQLTKMRFRPIQGGVINLL